ncbi:hypothetical protein [Deinococcus apachensis]|uniref:hypothetical protein n=1 Tax=Deinococcus apachensis TaxID=309886 RepID=UPI00036B2634|nr:hypothetical protein [Deinococcus apachensis]
MTSTRVRSPRPEISTIEQAFREFPEHLYRDPGVVVEQDTDLLLAVSFAPAPDLNLVYGGYTGPDAGQRLTITLARLRAWNVPFLWLVPPAAADLSAKLAAHGLPRVADLPIMTLDLARLNPADARVEGLTLRRVTTEEDLRAWVAVSAEAFHFNEETAQKLIALGRDPVLGPDSRAHLYLGLLDGEPVSTALNIHGEEIVGMWCIGTLELARRRGIGAAMTTGPLLEAREAGYAAAMLGATELGFPVYSRLGWEVRYSTPVHLGGQE